MNQPGHNPKAHERIKYYADRLDAQVAALVDEMPKAETSAELAYLGRAILDLLVYVARRSGLPRRNLHELLDQRWELAGPAMARRPGEKS